VERLWYNKERMVLVVLVAVLCWNVYKVVSPGEETKEIPHALPKGAIDSNYSSVLPIPPPPPRTSAQWDTIYTPNPFWYFSAQTVSNDNRKGPEDAGIRLLDMKKVRDKHRVKLQTAAAEKWYYEGDAFESFELLSIDPDEGTCQVRSERLGRVITLRLPGK
jgi:hypothetical protein